MVTVNVELSDKEAKLLMVAIDHCRNNFYHQEPLPNTKQFLNERFDEPPTYGDLDELKNKFADVLKGLE